jgi:hypothetical protein
MCALAFYDINERKEDIILFFCTEQHTGQNNIATHILLESILKDLLKRDGWLFGKIELTFYRINSLLKSVRKLSI